MASQPRLSCRGGRLQQLNHLEGADTSGTRSKEVAELAHDVARARHLRDDLVHRFLYPRWSLGLRIDHHLASPYVASNGCQRLIELMCKRGRHFARAG